jgi:hypothetical protein
MAKYIDKYIQETYNEGDLKGKCKCKCGSVFIDTSKLRCKHFSTKKHQKYIIEEYDKNAILNPMVLSQFQKLIFNGEIPEIPLPLPATIQEIEELPIPDVIIEPIEEITASVPDIPLTKAEIAKKKKQEYMRVYMRKYHAKRYNEDEEYRKYRIEMTNKSSCVMRTRYIKAYQYIKDNNIAIFDEKGN